MTISQLQAYEILHLKTLYLRSKRNCTIKESKISFQMNTKRFLLQLSLARGVLQLGEEGHWKETPVAYCGSTLLFSGGVARRRSFRRRRIFLRFPFRDMRRKSAPFREGISSCGRSVRGKSRQTTRRVVGT